MKIKLKTKFWDNKTQDEWRDTCKQLMEATLVMLLITGMYAVYNQITFLLIATLLFMTIPTLAIITYHMRKKQNDTTTSKRYKR